MTPESDECREELRQEDFCSGHRTLIAVRHDDLEAVCSRRVCLCVCVERMNDERSDGLGEKGMCMS